MAYPATFDIEPPRQEYDRAQVILRIVLVLILAWLLNGIVGAAYWVLPIIAAILISQRGAERYLADAEKGPVTWLRYIMGFYSYLALASDKLPLESPEEVNLQVRTTGSPSVGSALLRIILGIPHAIVLGILGIAFVVVWIIAAISIIASGTYPDWAFNFIRGYLRWQARLLAYMASLVDEYPPFSFSDDGATAMPPPPPAQQATPPPPEPPASSPGGPPGS
jgi:hypothetical protein